MALQLTGTAVHADLKSIQVDRALIRLRSVCELPLNEVHDFALVRCGQEFSQAYQLGWRSFVFIGDVAGAASVSQYKAEVRSITLSECFDYLARGDILGIDCRSGKFRVLFRRGEKHNSFLVTERCFHRCLMCSQPPKRVDDGWLLEEIAACLPLLERDLPFLTFTGGEPLTDWRGFLEVLHRCKIEIPSTAVQVLTTGRSFAQSEVVDSWRRVDHPNLIAAIPLYSAIDHVHDYIVQSAGAFDETVLGILKLKDRGGRIELRVVFHAITAPGIADTCRWISRNLPFVDHVALMGLENAGFAIANDSLLWIDPLDYQDQLSEAVELLSLAGLCVSLYNLPLCLLGASIRHYAARSISDWKRGLTDECDRCAANESCCGVFTSGKPKLSRGIKALGHI